VSTLSQSFYSHQQNNTEMAKVLDKLSAGNNLTKEDCALFVQQARELAGTTGIEIFILLTRRGNVKTYSTEGFSPLIDEGPGRMLIVKVLRENYRPKQAPEQAEENTTEDNLEENFTLIEDHKVRHDTFTATFNALREALISKTRPNNTVGEEGLLIVATPSHKVLTWSSPGFDPLTKTADGQKVLSSLLNQNFDGESVK
jgi:hypothetical protein